MMDSVYLLALMAGLTGGIGHCTGMCGPIVASYSLALKSRSFVPHVLYNAGRVTTYALMGAAVGFAGSFAGSLALGRAPAHGSMYLHWAQRVPLAAAGALIILMGLGMAGLLPLARLLEKWALGLSVARRAVGLLRGGATVGAFYPMGVALGFIPCGLVYSALVTAAGAGIEAGGHAHGLLRGGALMLLFGAGTAAPLMAFGKVVGFLGTKARARLYRLSSAFVVAMGIIILVRALR
jgi:sulfite exporter TauE/SafE